MNEMIPVAFISDADFLMQTSVAITSLIKNKNPSTMYDIHVILSSEESRGADILRSIPMQGSRLHIIHASVDKYRDIKQVAHIPIACLLKFDLCELIPDYDKILYIDGDVYIRGDLSEVYGMPLGESHIGGVKSLEMIDSNRALINAGVILFNAGKMREDHMAQYLVQKRRKLGEAGSMDQKVMNLVFGDELVFLPYGYNCVANQILDCKKRFSIKKLNWLYGTSFQSVKEFLDSAVIIHFASGSKPWKYSFLYGGEEWYKCYLDSVYGGERLVRKNRTQVRCQVFCREIRKRGLRGLAERLKHYKNWAAGKNDMEMWG